MHVVEIAVRFDETTVDVRQLGAGTYRIGTARDVDLAVVGLTSFPLVDWTDRGCMVRVPAGFTAKRCPSDRSDRDSPPLSETCPKRVAKPYTPHPRCGGGEAHRCGGGEAHPRCGGGEARCGGGEARCGGEAIDGPVLLAAGDEVELSIGRIHIRVSATPRATAIPRPPIELRWWRWAVGAFAIHLLFLGVAHALATPEPEGVYVQSIVSLLPRRPEPENPALPPRVVRKPQKRSAKQQQVTSVPAPQPEPAQRSEPARRERAVAESRGAGILGGIRATDIRKLTGTVDIKKVLDDVGPVYREHEAEERGFGGGRHYVPADSIKTGRYETVAKGRAVGDHYALPGEVGRKAPASIEHPSAGCSATGTMSCDSIRTTIATRNQSLLDCFDRHGGKKPGSVAIEFEVGANGKVVHAHGEGLGYTGGCISGVMRRVVFPKTDGATTAKYSVTFTP